MMDYLAIVIALVVGIGCRLLDIPLPAPARLEGAALIAAMTGGVLVGRYLGGSAL